MNNGYEIMPENEEKFLDISPPHKIDTQGLKMLRPKRGGKPLLRGKKIFLALLLLFIVGAAFLFLQGQKVEIKIWPATETLNIEKEITLKEGAAPNFSALILPAIVLETESQKSQKFPSSYVPQEKKAEGVIRVYNLYSTASLPLVAQTRFLSEDGKLFRTPEKIVIPGKKLEKGKWVPGTLNVKVVAAEPGESYNIPASKFSLPGLAGTSLYTLVYGESFKTMTGGSSGEGHQVLTGDLETAENILAAKIEKENLEALKQEASQQGQFLVEETASHEIVETASSEKPGASVDEFEFTAKVKTKALALKKETLDRLAEELINSGLTEGKMLWPETLTLNWQTKEADLEEGEVKVALKISAKVSDEIQKIALLDSLKGKSISEALFLLKNQFEKAEVKASPFWLKKIPKNSQKIDLEFKID